MSSIQKRILGLALALVVVALAGAAAVSRATAGKVTARDPFTSQTGAAQAVEFKGYAHGHRAGNTARFELMLRNDGTERWQGHYCLTLVGRDGPIATLAAGDYDLPPATAEARTIDAQLPAGLAEGCYGLALVLPERMASVTTITVGNVEACDESWPVPPCP